MRSYGVFLSLSDPLLSHCMYFSWVISFEPESLIIIYMPMNINFICPSQIFHFHSRATLLLPTWTFCLSKEPQTCPFKKHCCHLLCARYTVQNQHSGATRDGGISSPPGDSVNVRSPCFQEPSWKNNNGREKETKGDKWWTQLSSPFTPIFLRCKCL